MTIEEFIKKNWEQYKEFLRKNWSWNSCFFAETEPSKETEACLRFWFGKAQEFYNVRYLTNELVAANLKNAEVDIKSAKLQKIEAELINEKLETPNPKLQWQPAETAPKDGRYFLGYRQDGGGKYFRVLQIKPNSSGSLSLYDENSKMPWSSLGYLINWLPLSELPPIPEEKKELVLEVGKYYRTVRGKFYFIGRSSWIVEDFLIGEIEKRVVSLKLSEIISEWEE